MLQTDPARIKTSLYLPVNDKGEFGGEGQPLEKGDHAASIHRKEILVIPLGQEVHRSVAGIKSRYSLER